MLLSPSGNIDDPENIFSSEVINSSEEISLVKYPSTK